MISKVTRNKKPTQQRRIKFTLPETISFKLDNNLQVYFVQKVSLPFLNMSLVTDAGSKYDQSGRKGLSNLLAMVIDEGAGEYDSLQLSDQFEVLGANFHISCDQDSIYLSLQILNDQFEKGLDLFTAIITDSHLAEDDFKREKRKVKTRILQKRDDSEEIANEVFEYKLFGDNNPYGFPIIGYEGDIDLISLQNLKDYYKDRLLPTNSFLVIVGDYDTDNLKKLLNKYFLRWKNIPPVKPDISFNSTDNPGLYLVDKKESVQSEIRTGLLSFKRNEYDFYARSVLNLILGGQFSSRLNLNLREKKGYTYGVYSRFIYLKSSAYFFATTSVSSENTAAALNEIYNEINKIKKGVTKKELEFARASLIRKFPSGFESYRQITLNIIGRIVHSLPEDYLETYTDEIRRVTLDRVIKAAEDNLDVENLTTVIVGNKEKISDQLKNIHPDGFTELDERGKQF